MNTDKVLALAREAGFMLGVDASIVLTINHDGICTEELTHFAALLQREMEAENAELLKDALKSLKECEGATAYSSHDDSVGYRVCCQVPSYYPHEKGCHIPLIIARITASLNVRERK